MNIQWFPGHMTKARRMMEENIKFIDCIVEIVDARCPKSSRNPELSNIAKGKKRLVLINKCDIADSEETKKWQQVFEREGASVLCISATSGKGVDKVPDAVKSLLKEKIDRDKERGLVNRPIRIMICGIPNVGKSMFINKLCGKGATKVGDRPGVTRGKQWVALKGGIEILDTPGILWPKFEDKEVGMLLAYTGAIKDDILDVEELCMNLLSLLARDYKSNLEERYKIEVDTNDGWQLLNKIGRKRGFVVKNNEVDTLRTANIILDEFRSAKIGKITLEKAQ